MSKEIIIQYIPQEIRVAIREESRLKEIFIERPSFRNPVGNIYNGKVLKVLPGMASAFVDIGLPKAAFLNINDIAYDSLTEEDTTNGKDKNENTKTVIQDLLTEGQSLLVQVSKAPISSKGARITTDISIPGRNVVFLPKARKVSISRQITSDKDRARLNNILKRYKDSNFGLIVRTFGQKSTEEELRNEIDFLVKIWSDIETGLAKSRAPTLLFEEPNIILQILRDSLNNEIDNIVIDDEEEHQRLKHYLQNYAPSFVNKLTYYNHPKSIFDAYGLNNDLYFLMERKVPLASGGCIIIDQAEALTSIDVNTGKFTTGISHENTVLQTNMEAVKEIIHQIRLRNIGGIIIIDLIDMNKSAHRQQVYTYFKAELKKDRARSQISSISDMGLIEMTRQRSQENINKLLSSPCYYCNGTGLILSNDSTFFSICRELFRLKRHSKNLPQEMFIYVHPDIVDFAQFQYNDGFKVVQKTLKMKLWLIPRHDYIPSQYKISSLRIQ